MVSNRAKGNPKKVKAARRARNPLQVKHYRQPRALKNRSKYTCPAHVPKTQRQAF